MNSRYLPRLAGALGLLLALCGAGPVGAAPVRTDHVEADLVAQTTSAQPGQTLWVAVRLLPDPGWHIYWKNPGDSGLPTRAEWLLPDGVTAGDFVWPHPHVFTLGDIVNYGYGEETLHLVPVSLPADWPAGKPLALSAIVKWLVCSDICIPGEAEVSLDLPVAATPPADDPDWAQQFAAARAAVPVAADWPARFDAAGDRVVFEVRAPELAATGEIESFPAIEGLVNHSSPPALQRDGDTLVVLQQRSEYFTTAPETVELVLVLGEGHDARAWAVQAQRADLSALRAGAGVPGGASGGATGGDGTAGGGTGAAPASGTAPPAGAGGPGLLLALGLAFLGGLVLNLMPCVFPILSIKAVSVLESRDGARAHALAYTAGVVGSFVAAGIALAVLAAGGRAVGWGFQLQEPLFVALLAYLFFAMALSLSGMVHFGLSLMGLGQGLVARGGLTGSFFTGVLAVVVASPCTAPFMGSALGWAVTQPVAVSLPVFAALGVGLAAPFLVLGFAPGAGRFLPKPGAWMETFRQFMAFPLYLTVVWLLWVLGGLTSRDGIAMALIGLVLVAFALWLWHREGFASRALRYAALALAVAALVHPALRLAPADAAAAAQAAAADGVQPWSAAKVTELRAAQRNVFVNFTADWCITCKVNERVALRSDAVKAAFALHDVAYLQGDWTRSDPLITAELARHGRNGVPLYLLYRAGAEPEVLPQLLTPDLVAAALNRNKE